MTISFIKNDRQGELYSLIEKLANTFHERASMIDEKGEFPFENIEDLRRAGYTGLTVPKKYGGEEISLYELVLLQERLAQGDGSTALSIGWHLGTMMDIEEKQLWKEEKIASVAHEVLHDGVLLNRAVTEPGTGSPTRGGKPQTVARQENGKWIISGRKTFTTMAPILDYFIVIASIEGSEDLGEFLIHRNKKGVSINETWNTISMRGTGSHDLLLDLVELNDEDLVDIHIKGRKVSPSGWMLHIPACYVGIAIAAKNYAIQFANEYSPNSINGPIKQLPNVQRLVGEMEAELIQVRHFMYAIAEKWDQAKNRGAMASELGLVKYFATNTALSVVDKAMRVVGAKSLHLDNPLQRYYRDVRAGLHNPPMDDMTISRLANSAFNTIER